jgi:hypothetical protein
LLQATSLPFIVAATTIGLQVHAIKPANAAALVAAGLFSVILFPVISLQLLRSSAGKLTRQRERRTPADNVRGKT